MAGKMKQFYLQALASYKYKDPNFHKYIAWKMMDWYWMFFLETTKAVVAVDESVEAEEVEEGAVVEAPPVVAN